jgi:lysyl-tRNA synthetase class 2
VSDTPVPPADNRRAPEAPSDYEASREAKLTEITKLGIDPWGGRFDGHQPIRNIRQLPSDANPPQRVRAAGRIIRRRIQGKAHFLDIRDWSTAALPEEEARIQVMAGQKQVGELAWQLAQHLDLGDIIGVDGTLGKTRRGELTIFADGLCILSKSLLPHPDKWAGMQDMEFRLRHRYLDLVYNQEMLARSLERIKIVRCVRAFLEDHGFVEVDTPTLHAIAGGAAARPFITHHNALDIDLFLRIALELHLKRLLVGGMERVFEIGRVFRNEGIDARHNPEFSMLEVYQAYGNYETMMDLTEGMFVASARALGDNLRRPYGDLTIDYTPPWPRLTYQNLFEKHVGVSMTSPDEVAAAAHKHGLQPQGKATEVLVHQLFELEVEKHLATLDRPVFVHDYPAALCPLTRRKRDNQHLAERFELYVAGMELANAYTELNDPDMQEQTFRQQLAGLPEEQSMARMDEDFIRALRHGMPPAGGLGVGIDRLVMLLTNTTTIRDVILFPLLRPEKKP